MCRTAGAAKIALGVVRPEQRCFLGWGAALTAVGLAKGRVGCPRTVGLGNKWPCPA